MDADHIDAAARFLAAAASRRGLFGGALAAFGLAGLRPGVAIARHKK
jgi:hypothetical protein